MIVRLCKIALVVAVALFFGLAAYGNITDYDTNWAFVQHVMSMDTTFNDPDLMWRAVTNPEYQRWVYLTIIGTQCLTALFCGLGALRMLINVFNNDALFNKSKSFAMFGTTLGFLFYAVGFLIIAGEWFAMWQSETWNGQAAATRFLFFIGAVLIILTLKDETVVEDIYEMKRR